MELLKQVPIKLYFSLLEAELATTVSQHTWRYWTQIGKVTFTRVGRKILIPVGEIERILRKELRERKLEMTQKNEPLSETAMTHEQIVDHNKRYWQQEGGEMKKNIDPPAGSPVKQDVE